MPRLGPGLGLDLPTARRRSAFFREAAHRLDGAAPALAADFVRNRHALGGAPVPLSSVLTVSSGAKRVFDASGALATVPANTPAFRWRGGKRRLLIEGPAVNLAWFSDMRLWTPINGLAIADGPVGPDGVTPWARIADTNDAGTSNLRVVADIPQDTTTYVASLLVLKDPTAVSNGQLRINLAGGATPLEFRLAVKQRSGGIGDTSGSPVGAWYTDHGLFGLVEMAFANNGTNNKLNISYFPAAVPDPDSASVATPSTTTGHAYVAWGQAEVGTRATSRILAAGTQATRIADVVQLSAGAAATLQGAAASLAWRGRVLASAPNMPLVGLPSGYALLRVSADGFNAVLDGSSSSGLVLSTSVSMPAEVPAAIGWDGTGRAGALNGESAKSDAAALDRSRASVWLGGYQGLPAGRALEIDELVVWPVRGSNAALTAQARGWA